MTDKEKEPTPTSIFADYKQKRLCGLKAMYNNNSLEGLKCPTGTWAGYGISETSPITPTTNESVNMSLSVTPFILYKNT